MTKKQYSPMRCALCGRPLEKAAALKGGRPVGRICAAKAGLIKPRAPVEAAPRDTYTQYLFA